MATSGYMKGKGDAKKSVSAGQVSASKVNTASPSKGYVKPGKQVNMVGSKSLSKVSTKGSGKGLGAGVKPDTAGGMSKRFGGSK